VPLYLDTGLFLDSGLFLDWEDDEDETPVIVASGAVTTRPVSRLLVLGSLGGSVIATYEGDGRIIRSGTVTADRARNVRRRGDLTLVNADGTLTPSAIGDLFWPGAIIRVERGVYVGDEPDYLALGTFVVSRFTSDMDGNLHISGEDPLSLLAQPFGETVVIPAGTSPEDALRLLWVPALDPIGLGAEWTLDGGGRTMPLRAFLRDESRLNDVITYFARSGLEVFADRLGYPYMRPFVDLAEAETVALVREFVPGDDAILLSWSRTGGYRTFNRVRVTSNNPGGTAIDVTVEVTDPASPIHKSRIGVREAPQLVSAQVPDIAAATLVGQQALAEYGLSSDTTSGSAVPDITLDAGDIVSIEEPVSGTSGRYRLNSLTLPVVEGSMYLTAGKVVPMLLTEDV
jgi:hypothetical protein